MKQTLDRTVITEPLGPESLVWRLGFPRTALLYAGRSLLLQVAHPVVGAGVRDFSSFRVDPWGRLDRTLQSLLTQMFGGEHVHHEADRLRAMHRSINGVGFDGERYTALRPEAWAWVHLSNFDSASLFYDELVRPLTLDERRQHFAEWRRIGLLLGIRDDDMPATVDDLAPYVTDMVSRRLTANPTTHDVLASLQLRDVEPPTALLPAPLWAAMKPLGRTVLHDFTVGTLPPALRDRMGLDWSPADQRRLDRLRTLVRAASTVVPDRVLHYPVAYRARVAARAYERAT